MMKRIKLSVTCLSISLLLFSCGSKSNETGGSESTAQDPKAFYDEVTLRVDNCDNAYFAFNDAVAAAEKNDIGIKYDAMVKTFDAEQKQIANANVATGGADQTLSKSFKDAASKYIDTYVACGKKELLEIKNYTLEGKTTDDQEVIDADDAANDKLGEVTMPFVKLRKEFRDKNGIKKQ